MPVSNNTPYTLKSIKNYPKELNQNNQISPIDLKQATTITAIKTQQTEQLTSTQRSFVEKAISLTSKCIESIISTTELAASATESLKESNITESAIKGLEHTAVGLSGIGTVVSGIETANAMKDLSKNVTKLDKAIQTETNQDTIQALQKTKQSKINSVRSKQVETALDATKTTSIGLAKLAGFASASLAAVTLLPAAIIGVSAGVNLKSVAMSFKTKKSISKTPLSLKNSASFQSIQKALTKKSNKVIWQKATTALSLAAPAVGMSLLAVGLVSNPVGWGLMGVGAIGLGVVAIRHHVNSRHNHKISASKQSINTLKQSLESTKPQASQTIQIPRSLAKKLIESEKTNRDTIQSNIPESTTSITTALVQTNYRKDTVTLELNHLDKAAQQELLSKLESDLNSRDDTTKSIETSLKQLYLKNDPTVKKEIKEWVKTTSGSDSKKVDLFFENKSNALGSPIDAMMGHIEGNIFSQ